MFVINKTIFILRPLLLTKILFSIHNITLFSESGEKYAQIKHHLKVKQSKTVFHRKKHYYVFWQEEMVWWICFLQTHKMLMMDWSGVDYLWLIVKFYQLFGLSFRWHPFTAEED